MRSLEITSSTVDQWREAESERHLHPSPVLLPNALSVLVGEVWNPQFFASMYPDIKVRVAVKLPQKEVPYELSAKSHYKDMEMREFLEMLGSAASCYLSQFPVQRFPGLLRQLRLSAFNLNSVNAVNLWIGGATRSGLHFDGADNLFAQIHGHKRVFLINPKFSRHLYQFPDSPTKSKVDPEKPDLQRFPAFDKCDVIHCELNAGDLLFIPKGWWHFVSADDISISLNCWYGKELSFLALSRLYSAAGPAMAFCCVRDFVQYGLLGRKYQRRLFSPDCVGVQLYQAMNRLLHKEPVQ
jgi:hypothetical protein